ncbi:MAG: helix-turn-helix transcriptional regulator [Tatlockia sp.]|nr:helix-turn-helix transcriptional regulator [Tatlockia sp.]
MPKSLNEKLKNVTPERQALIQERADNLIAEEMTLRDLRLALHKTQNDLSAKLHISQDSVSRLEKRSDMLLSTLGKYVASLGGTLRITAEFPNRPPVIIHSVSDIEAH